MKTTRIELDKECISRLYLNDKKTVSEISQIIGNASPITVSRRLKEWGIRRTKQNSIRYRDGKKLNNHTIDTSFFKAWSPKMSWVLGIIATDGNIEGKHVLRICSSDVTFLSQISSIMDSTYQPIKRNTIIDGKKYTGYVLKISNTCIVKDVTELGIYSNKTFTIEFPHIPDEYMSHFIRGCWDGDGSICIRKAKQLLRSGYISASPSFTDALQEQLIKIGLPKRRYITAKGHHTIEYSHKHTLKLCEYMYQDSEDVRLERKYNVYLSLKDKQLKKNQFS